MKNPEEPPAPPPEDLPWSEVSGPEILHLTDANFKDELKKKKHVLGNKKITFGFEFYVNEIYFSVFKKSRYLQIYTCMKSKSGKV